MVAFSCYFTLLKGQEICAYSPKYGILVELAVQCFSKMLEKNSVPFKSLLTRFCEMARRSVAWDLFNAMVGDNIDFTMADIVNTYGLLMKLWIKDEIQGFVAAVDFGLDDFVESLLI